jgi:nucleoside-diphosphate-sugar epimerase
VHDLASLLLALSAFDAPSSILIEPDDGTPDGWSHRDFARALGEAMGTKPAIVYSPGVLLRLAARADQFLRREKAKLTVDRAAYFSHRNWVVEPKRASPRALWQPKIRTPDGLRQTAHWYREAGWL